MRERESNRYINGNRGRTLSLSLSCSPSLSFFTEIGGGIGIGIGMGKGKRIGMGRGRGIGKKFENIEEREERGRIMRQKIKLYQSKNLPDAERKIFDSLRNANKEIKEDEKERKKSSGWKNESNKNVKNKGDIINIENEKMKKRQEHNVKENENERGKEYLVKENNNNNNKNNNHINVNNNNNNNIKNNNNNDNIRSDPIKNNNSNDNFKGEDDHNAKNIEKRNRSRKKMKRKPWNNSNNNNNDNNNNKNNKASFKMMKTKNEKSNWQSEESNNNNSNNYNNNNSHNNNNKKRINSEYNCDLNSEKSFEKLVQLMSLPQSSFPLSKEEEGSIFGIDRSDKEEEEEGEGEGEEEDLPSLKMYKHKNNKNNKNNSGDNNSTGNRKGLYKQGIGERKERESFSISNRENRENERNTRNMERDLTSFEESISIDEEGEIDNDDDEDEDVEAMKGEEEEGEGGNTVRDKRMIFATSKDSKVVRLWQYIKERKKAKVLREQFLVAKGLINTETDPPQRYIEVYYKHDADDFYTAITTTSYSFGGRLNSEEVYTHTTEQILEWLHAWYLTARKHNVLHSQVGSIIESFLHEEYLLYLNSLNWDQMRAVKIPSPSSSISVVENGPGSGSGNARSYYNPNYNSHNNNDNNNSNNNINNDNYVDNNDNNNINMDSNNFFQQYTGKKIWTFTNLEDGLKTIRKSLKKNHRSPRIFTIGDVHGCIEEMTNILKKIQFSPGDLVIFLGDLVAKGPASFATVRLAREIGALSVRGNHENEVVRWNQVINAGAKSNFRSEHFLIANQLSKEDNDWLRSLPWYISSSELKVLCVHAGFVFGLRLSRQNPRLMTNMRSIMPDGSVSSRFHPEYPWARLWFGPQTVIFGHDARRGLQMYENAIGLDTGCVYGGNLTALTLPERTFTSVEANTFHIGNRYNIFNEYNNNNNINNYNNANAHDQVSVSSDQSSLPEAEIGTGTGTSSSSTHPMPRQKEQQQKLEKIEREHQKRDQQEKKQRGQQ